LGEKQFFCLVKMKIIDFLGGSRGRELLKKYGQNINFLDAYKYKNGFFRHFHYTVISNKNMTNFHERCRDIFIGTCCLHVVLHDNTV
jgi:hypothetical protein